MEREDKVATISLVRDPFGLLLLLVAPDSKSDKDLNPGSRSLGSVGDIPPQRGRPTSESIA